MRGLNSNEINLLILCGGQGKRLRSCVDDRPKALAEIAGKAFLDILIDSLSQYSFNRIILSVGYLKEQIKEHFDINPDDRIIFSEEEIPLGTGGALKKARPLLGRSTFLVMNGDSVCNIDFEKLFNFHKTNNALMSMVLTRAETSKDYGFVAIDDLNKIISFKEKVKIQKDALVSAGIYLMQNEIFNYLPSQDCFSLEHDFFPKILDKGCYGYVVKSELIDIGTPERYKRANNLLKKKD